MRDTLSVIEVARELRSLKIQSRQVYDMIASGEIKATKCGNRWKVPKGEVKRLLSKKGLLREL